MSVSKNISSKEKLSRKIKALRKLQCDAAVIDGMFTADVLKLESKYDRKYKPFYERRRQIISGEHEPSEEEADIQLTYVEIPDYKDENAAAAPKNIKGIPGFWFNVLNNIPMFWFMIQEHDSDALKHLRNISCERNLYPDPGFTLKFEFAPNNYFKNSELTKKYILTFGKKENDPFNVLGPEMVDCIGCNIEWKNQDLTTVIKKRKLVKRASFFNFFDPPKSTEDPQLEPYVLNYLMTDFQLGYYLKERVIPKAILYFLGEATLRENFGFDRYIAEKGEPNVMEDWPTSYDRKMLNHPEQGNPDGKYELKSNKQMLAEILSKAHLEKVTDRKKNKVKGDKVKATKHVKEKTSNKEMKEDILKKPNNYQKDLKLLNPKNSKNKSLTMEKKTSKNERKISSTVLRSSKKMANNQLKKSEKDKSSIDSNEMDIDLQAMLEQYYNESANTKTSSTINKRKK